MHLPSHLRKKEEQYNQRHTRHGSVLVRAQGGEEATVLNTAPLGKTMTASDNAEIQGKAKTGGGKKSQATLKTSESSIDN